jgi:DNA-3-methyladenine glycosylase
MRPVPRSFYRRDASLVAPDLLNKVLVAGDRAGRIVEVEAYRGREDPGSHAFRGQTRRNATMFGPPGHLYVYFSYGVHWCANAVCDRAGIPHAVLLRAIAPVSGTEEMRTARSLGQKHPLTDRDLGRGPGRLCQALGLTREHDGADVVTGDRDVWIMDDGRRPPDCPGVGTRVGLSAGGDHRWRYWVPGDPHVSGPLRPAGTGTPPVATG